MVSIVVKFGSPLVFAGALVVICAAGCSGSAGSGSGGTGSGVTGAGLTGGGAPVSVGEESPVDSEAASMEAQGAGEVSLKQIDLAGIAELVAANRGKLVLIDVWSTACIPCMQEFPNLVELSGKYSGDLICVSLNVDYIGLKSKPPESYREKVLGFLEKQSASGVRNFLASQPDTEILQGYSVESMPAIILYGRDGEILEKFTDANSGEDGLSYAAT